MDVGTREVFSKWLRIYKLEYRKTVKETNLPQHRRRDHTRPIIHPALAFRQVYLCALDYAAIDEGRCQGCLTAPCI